MGCTCTKSAVAGVLGPRGAPAAEQPGETAAAAELTGSGQRPAAPAQLSSLGLSGPRRDIREYYRIGGVLGSGSFGQVRACLKKATNEPFAVKIMAKDPPKERRGSNNVDFTVMFRNEVTILSALSHSHVVRVFEFFEDKQFLYAVMDKCDGGELFSHIVKKRRFEEHEAALLTYQMLQAIRYVHSRNIIHRDIKAENFLFHEVVGRNPANKRLVLIDFGMSIRVTDPAKNLRQLCGSPHYVAPELIRRNYRFKVDMWALGVVVYLMLFGRYPFEGPDQKAIVHAILNSRPDFSLPLRYSKSSAAAAAAARGAASGGHAHAHSGATPAGGGRHDAHTGSHAATPGGGGGTHAHGHGRHHLPQQHSTGTLEPPPPIPHSHSLTSAFVNKGATLPAPSGLALAFISALLEKDPELRMDPETGTSGVRWQDGISFAALAHCWIRHHCGGPCPCRPGPGGESIAGAHARPAAAAAAGRAGPAAHSLEQHHSLVHYAVPGSAGSRSRGESAGRDARAQSPALARTRASDSSDGGRGHGPVSAVSGAAARAASPELRPQRSSRGVHAAPPPPAPPPAADPPPPTLPATAPDGHSVSAVPAAAVSAGEVRYRDGAESPPYTPAAASQSLGPPYGRVDGAIDAAPAPVFVVRSFER